MKCPLAFGYYKSGETGSLFGVHDCLKEECAWWDKAYQRCGVLSMGVELDMIDKRLLDIEDKMPSAGQFVK